jgi:thiol-disulfide isomerase/thioredoxin
LEAAAYKEGRTRHLLQTVRYDDSVLQKSGFLMEHSLRLIKASPLSYEKILDGIANNLKACKKEFQKVFMMRLWQRIQEANKVIEANYLAEKHLIPLAIQLGDRPLANELKTIVNTSIGAKAPNFFWTDEADQSRSLYDLKTAEHYILVFWSSTCPHCLKELPELQKAIEILPKGKYQVIAFGLEDDIYGWKNETYRLPEFLHVPGLGKWENETGNAYNVSQTPTYYVLDSEKVIMAKPEELADLLRVIQANKH